MNLTLAKNYIHKIYFKIVNSSSEVKSRGYQSIILFSAWIGALGLNFLGSVLTTKLLGPSLYGDYKFVQTLWALLTILSTLGFVQSGSRVILLETNPTNAKKIIGVVLVLALIMGIVVGLFTLIIANPVDRFFHTHVALIIMALSPLIIGLTLRDALLLILQSTNQITLMAALEFFPSFLYIFCLYGVSKMLSITTGITLAIQQMTILGTVIVIILVVKPHIGSFWFYIQKIREENKKYGFPIYMGILATTATSYINRLSISYWVDNTAIGFFSLASTITEPLRLIPNAAAISSFKSFSIQEKISKKILWFAIISSLFCLVAALLLIDPVLKLFYSKGFSSVGPMAKILVFGAIAQGFGDFINRFLGAHGKGKNLRNVAYLVGIINVLGFIFLTPFLGVNGVVITTVIACLSNFIFMFISYKRFHD